MFYLYSLNYFYNSVTTKAITKPPMSVIILFWGVLYKIINVVINIMVLIILVKLKYHIPIPKQHNIIIAIIQVLIITGIIPEPFEYQHINAKIGENKVKKYHIII